MIGAQATKRDQHLCTRRDAELSRWFAKWTVATRRTKVEAHLHILVALSCKLAFENSDRFAYQLELDLSVHLRLDA